MTAPQPGPAARAALFRLAVVEGEGLNAQEIGCAIVAGSYEPDPANGPTAYIAHVPEPPEQMQRELDLALHPGRHLRCDRMPTTPDEEIIDGFARMLGASENQRCWACEEPSAWQCFVKLQIGSADAVLACFFHCNAHRPGDVPVEINGAAMHVVRRPDSPAWAMIQDTTRPPT